jgi:hypothetical protein
VTALAGLGARVRQAAAWRPEFGTTPRVLAIRCRYCRKWRKPRHFRSGARGCRRCIGD